MIICNTNIPGGVYEIPVTTKPNATIKATGPTSVTVKADADGKATMKLNRRGSYTVVAELDGATSESKVVTVPAEVELNIE